jgi:hypothetical protein
VPVATRYLGVISPLVAVWALLPATGLGEPSAGIDASRPAMAPTEGRLQVVLRISGQLDVSQSAALVSLLETELAHSEVQLVLNSSDEDVLGWIGATRQDSRVLLIVWLDTRDRDLFKLYVVDAARNRAMMRALPGGLKQDAATVEAVASIVVSAVNALREGRQVASKPVEEVVEVAPATTPGQPSGSDRSGRAARPGKEATRPSTPRAPTRTPSSSATPLAAELGLGLTGGTFEASSPVTVGLSAFAGLVFSSEVAVRLSAARHLPVHIDTPFGRFRVDRTVFGACGGWIHRVGVVALEPELGLALQLLSRSEAEPTSEVSAQDDTERSHVGAEVGLRARYQLTESLALEPSAAALYFPSRIRYLAGSFQRTEIAAPWPIVGTVALGLVVVAP